MREIKFRAWIEAEKKYIYDCSPFLVSDSEFVVEQYTGLKDKNDKEIYEGDIVEAKDIGRFEVKWYDKMASFEFVPNMEMEYHPPFDYYQTFSYEVIGNIHENADLAEEK